MVMRFATMVLNNNAVSQARPPIAPPPISLDSSSDWDPFPAIYILIIPAAIACALDICFIAVEIFFREFPNNSQLGRGTALPPLHRETPAPMHRARRTGVQRAMPQAPKLLSATSVKEILRTFQGGEEHEECPICLNDFKVGETYRVLPSCNHKYHRMCINEWLLRDGLCPLCRVFVQGSALPNTNT